MSNPRGRRSTFADGHRIMLTTLEGVPGKEVVEHYGIVQGSTVRAKNVGKDLLAGLKNIVGGELKSYTELLQEARQEATERMLQQAEQIGANAVVNVRFATSSVAQGAAELYVYGTAVKVM
ncbi:MAG: YbjQ family protein [Cyanobacteria bacterium P01_F01_bin.150]